MRHEKNIVAENKTGRLLIACIISILCLLQATLAQSGRRQRKNASTPPPITTDNKTADDAQPKPPAKKSAPIATVIVGGDRLGTSIYIPPVYVDMAVKSCVDRFEKSSGIEAISGGGSMTRSMAKDRAKKESAAHVLWLELRVEDDGSNEVSISYLVLTPQTAKILTSGRVYLGSRSAGGGTVGVGVPSITGRLPLGYQIKEAGASVADRVKNKFPIRPAPAAFITEEASVRQPLFFGLLPFTSEAAPLTPPPSNILFDDFSYSKHKELTNNGWIIRSAAGWPGVPGATWWQEGVSFLKDTERPGNRILRMTSSTDGTGANTRQTQICHQRKYLEGTYAARVRFTDNPLSGPSGDQLVESFYTISPLKAPMDADYSELDFEYLPNGGWGISGPTLYGTTWETFSPEPNWQKDNVFNTASGSQAGWHTLVTQVASGKVKYFIDGKLLAEHGDRFYPESLMSINFNLWFIRDGMTKEQGVRSYHEDIDWVFFAAKTALMPNQVEDAVAALRRKSVKFRDTVRAPVPALVSPCDL
ncbi:MAG TPA: glycoside hydrolase family 16 protein [Pyrinomonadaceae bacterium]